MSATARSTIFERDDMLYLVAPVAPVELADGEEVAFADDLRKIAPSDHLGWLRGQYVEADRPNLNGQVWTADTLEIASVTPVLMPVTIMHDFGTAVGMIADAKLLTPAADSVPRARIDTTLGIWKHRFSDVWEEIGQNYRAGSLMQSMECRPAFYDCVACGQRFPKLPGNRESLNWCAHLKAEEVAAGLTKAARRLGNVTFTGTGLIYGSRGIKGALDTAHLEVFQDEVAEFHEKVKRDSNRTPKATRRKRTMDIDDREYRDLTAAKAELDQLKPRVADLEESAAKVPDLERKVDTLEVEKKQAEDARDAALTEKASLEEAANAITLAGERTGKLGDKFLAKLPDTVKARLVDEQAKKLSDDEWTARLEELATILGVQPDEKTDGGGGNAGGSGGSSTTHTREEIAAAGAASGGSGGGSGDPQEPTPAKRRSTIGSLAKTAAARR